MLNFFFNWDRTSLLRKYPVAVWMLIYTVCTNSLTPSPSNYFKLNYNLSQCDNIYRIRQVKFSCLWAIKFLSVCIYYSSVLLFKLHTYNNFKNVTLKRHTRKKIFHLWLFSRIHFWVHKKLYLDTVLTQNITNNWLL